MTVHGKEHSKAIIRILNQIIEIHNSSEARDIEPSEAKLLYLSAWLHDIGCVVSRKNHSKRSASLLKKLCVEYISMEEAALDSLTWIIKYHSRGLEVDGEDVALELDEVPKEYPYGKPPTRLRYLAALFRLADACDIETHRAPKIVFEVLRDHMDEESVEYWIAHQDIISLDFKPKENTIVLSCRKGGKFDVLVENLADELSTVRDIAGEEGFSCLEMRIEEIPGV